MRITRKVFTDLTIFMIFLGVAVGLVFPFFSVLLGVPKATAFKALFFGACVVAGVILAALDSLTGIYNRRFGFSRLQEEFGRAILYRHSAFADHAGY